MKTKRHCFSFRFRDTMTFGGTELETMKCCEHIFYRFLESWLFIMIIFFTNQSGTLFFIDIPRFLISRNATKPQPVWLNPGSHLWDEHKHSSTRNCKCSLRWIKHKHKCKKKGTFSFFLCLRLCLLRLFHWWELVWNKYKHNLKKNTVPDLLSVNKNGG